MWSRVDRCIASFPYCLIPLPVYSWKNLGMDFDFALGIDMGLRVIALWFLIPPFFLGFEGLESS